MKQETELKRERRQNRAVEKREMDAYRARREHAAIQQREADARLLCRTDLIVLADAARGHRVHSAHVGLGTSRHACLLSQLYLLQIIMSQKLRALFHAIL